MPYPSAARGTHITLPTESGIPMPPLTNAVLILSTFGIAPGWQNNSPLISATGDIDTSNVSSTETDPYPLNWVAPVWADVGANPRLGTWYDQSGNAFDATQGTDAQRPDISIVNERFDFTSADSQFVATDITLPFDSTSVNKLTGYIVASVSSFAAAAPICQLQYADNYLTEPGNFAVYTAATTGVLSVTQNTIDTIPVFNSKLRTLVAGTRYLISFVFDRTIAGAGATVLRVQNVTTGVTNGSTSNMNSNFFADALFGIGTGKPLATQVYLDGSVEHLSLFTVAHSGAQMDEWANWLCQPNVFNIAI